jgi:hypothetical protein
MSTSSPCPCEGWHDPQVVTNPPGEPAISYRVDDFTGFRRALLQSRPGETALFGWRPAPGDLGLQALEWWAYLADILTFYNERIANESYLRTAQLPASVAGLVGLLGYRPRPGIAATGQLGAIRRAGHPREPLAIPAGAQFANQATPGVPVQTFEALAPQTFMGESDARAIPAPDPSLLSAPAPSTGAQSVLLAGTIKGIAAGDELLLVKRGWAGIDDNWAWVQVAAVAPEANPYGPPNTRVTFPQVTWGVVETTARPRRMLERSVSVSVTSGSMLEFGGAAFEPGLSIIDIGGYIARHRPPPPPPAPRDTTHEAGDYRLVRPLQKAALWSQTSDGVVTSLYPDVKVRLSAVVRSIAAGDLVLFDAGASGEVALAEVSSVSEELLTEQYPNSASVKPSPPDIVLPHTLLGLKLPSGQDADAVYALPATGTAVRYAFRDVGTPIPTPAVTLSSLPATVTVPVPADFSVPDTGVQAFVEDATGAGIPVIATHNDDGSIALSAVTIPPPAFAPLQVPLRLLIDLVGVSQGATVAGETLGTGNAALANQTFQLAKKPLTYLAQGNGYRSALRIAVDGIYWTELETVYGQAADAKIFTVRQRDDGASIVRFGDGINGARLPTGSQVIAGYRWGSGATSPPAGRLTTILKPQTNLAAVHNPVPVAGGADPEAPDSIRANAPTSVLTLGRAISAEDYQAVAAQAPGVSRAAAYWTWDADSQRTLVKVYVGDGAAAAGLAAKALAGAEDPNRPIAVVEATPIALDVACTVLVAADRVAPDVGTAAQAAIEALFRPSSMAIGAALYSSEIDDALLVPGAVAVHGLVVTVDGFALFPQAVAVALPGEGAYFTLASVHISTVSADG